MRATGILETTVGQGGNFGKAGLDLRVSYRGYNRTGVGTPLVCVPNVGMRRTDFQYDLLNSAAFRNRQMLTFDLPGHGKSSYPFGKGALHMDNLVEIVHDLTVESDLYSFGLLGIGIGGNIAMRYAERYPDRAVGLISVGSMLEWNCYNPTALLRTGSESLRGMGKRYRASEHPGRAEYATRILKGRGRVSNHIARLLATAAYEDVVGKSSDPVENPKPPLETLEELTMPKAYVQSEHILDVDEITGKLEQAGVTVLPVPNAGEFPHPGVDNPEGYVRALGSFMAVIDAA